ncbi:MAG: uracil phosphoribosyltransferase, partial [Verrucomicrobiota bacterium]|nr:uracil phosphoribosyltransferase [Verrucomicrobiota bacterium]
YYSKMPNFNDVQRAFLLDPMLATGGSASQSVVKLKESGVENVSMVSIVSAPEGLQHIQELHPDVDIFTASIDRELDINRYILPGLGDFGDRLFGTN